MLAAPAVAADSWEEPGGENLRAWYADAPWFNTTCVAHPSVENWSICTKNGPYLCEGPGWRLENGLCNWKREQEQD